MSTHHRIAPLSWGVKLLLIAGALQLGGCGESTSSEAGSDFAPDTNTDFDEAALIANLTDNVISPAFNQFVTVSQTQTSQIGAYCDAEKSFDAGNLDETGLSDAKALAQAGWRSAMQSWQQIEMMQVGPLLDDDNALRNKIYSWPVVSRCGVDLDVVAFENNDINGAPYNIKTRTPSRKGMVALEYLLFNPDLNHSCTGSAVPAGWDNRTDNSRRIARCEFASEVARDINDNANVLVDAWSGANGYAARLKAAGQAGSEFATTHDAVNRLSDAIFYIDSITKDAKLAKPLGLFANPCGTSVCPESVESQLSGESISNIEQNLKALQALYSGNEGVGFDDFLRDEQAADVAELMSTDIAAAIALSQSYQQSLAEALTEDEQKVTDTHAGVKKVTDTLKADFIQSLALELPQTSAGDND